MKKETIGVIMQAFYGNRTYTEMTEESIDRLLQGIMDSRFSLHFAPDRTIVRIPDSPCVIVYNRHQEEKAREKNGEYREKEGDIAKPLAFVPEQGIKIYSRCFVCRMGKSGAFESIRSEDYEKVFPYLAQ